MPRNTAGPLCAEEKNILHKGCHMISESSVNSMSEKGSATMICDSGWSTVERVKRGDFSLFMYRSASRTNTVHGKHCSVTFQRYFETCDLT